VLLWVLPSDLPNMHAAVGRYIATFLYTKRGRRHCCGTQPHNGEMNVAGVGGVANLPRMVAAMRPIDSLYSIVQMPKAEPVAANGSDW
jgi:hypothetical protein